MNQLSMGTRAAGESAIGIPINVDHFEPLDQRPQLFRYAQDLQELLAMQSRLLQRHQKVLQFFGRGEQDADMLLSSLLKSISLYLVTDKDGLIMQVSPDAAMTLSQPGRPLNFLPLQQLMPYYERDRIKEIIQSFSDCRANGFIRQDRLFLCAGDPASGDQGYEVLVLMVGMELYWLFGNPVGRGSETLDFEKAFPIFGDAKEALLITNADVRIRAVNPAFTRITGYSAAEVIGQNPRMLSSGLQDPPFYRSFWSQLQQNGSWTGELFNRRKNGQIYFEWATVKAVKDSLGETITYIAACADLSKGADEDKHYSLNSYTDLLTGLANRRLFEIRLMRALSNANRENINVSVLWIALERFDELARELGHEQADQLLQAGGKRLQDRMSPDTTVARVGGGNFLVLLPNDPADADNDSGTDMVRHAFTEPFSLSIGTISVTSVSVGLARYPKDGRDFEQLLRIARSEMQYKSPILQFAMARPDERLPPPYRQHPDFNSVMELDDGP